MGSISQTAPYCQLLLEAARQAANEEQFKIRAEGILESLCGERGIFWNPYTYEHSFKGGKKLDAVHGATIIEYEPPRSFKGTENAQFRHARAQAEEYARLLSDEEGRHLEKYSLVVWDGETIAFGRLDKGIFKWERARQFDELCLNRLLALIADGGLPLVSPTLLKHLVGPETDIGKMLIPALFDAARFAAPNSRTRLIRTEWSRLFAQVDGLETGRLLRHLKEISRLHNINYVEDPSAYLFALNTYIAIVAKICAVYALSGVDSGADPKTFLKRIEDESFFRGHGIENMLGTDFFSWYLGDDTPECLDRPLGLLLERLRCISFDVAQKTPKSVRDLFKGLYMGFTPASMRHALGEYYTPDWLAAHVLDVAGWKPEQSLLDPTCGSGTFVLEGLKRRLADSPDASASALLTGIWGFDLNPLAVLTAKASIVVSMAEKFRPDAPVLLPVFLADAINTADPTDGVFRYSLLTEKGPRTFAIPTGIAESANFFQIMNHLKVCIDAGLDSSLIMESLNSLSPDAMNLNGEALEAFSKTIDDLIDLHHNHWNGIWCLILFDRIKAGCVGNIELVAGNPPWVKWSHLPKQYAEFIKPICDRMNIFSEDIWVGGIESDISTVVTYRALERYVARNGSLAFLITGTVFKNESSQGFRRWMLGDEPLTVEAVEDYGLLRPFEGVANWPTLLLVRRNNQITHYPIPYRRYLKRGTALDLWAAPVLDLGTPWLVGTEQQLTAWKTLFCAHETVYRARKGVTTDCNGIFFVNAKETDSSGLIRIENDPRNGRRPDLETKSALVEPNYVYPLLRGRDVRRFKAQPRAGHCVIVPQTGMSGDEKLPVKSPRLFAFLSAFKSVLERRSSYRKFQRGKPFWSIWSTGAYTFAPYKVVWKEMSGSGFSAAYIDSADFAGSTKTLVPDHKLYFVPLYNENEAAYLCAFLNARIVASAIDAYSSALSLGTSATDYLKIPEFDPDNTAMQEMVEMAKRFKGGEEPAEEEEVRLDELVRSVISLQKT